MEEIFQACAQEDLKVTMAKTSFFLSHENLVSTDLPGMARWREGLFVWMNRNSLKATDFFIFPPTGWWSWGIAGAMTPPANRRARPVPAHTAQSVARRERRLPAQLLFSASQPRHD